MADLDDLEVLKRWEETLKAEKEDEEIFKKNKEKFDDLQEELSKIIEEADKTQRIYIDRIRKVQKLYAELKDATHFRIITDIVARRFICKLFYRGHYKK